MHNSKVGFSVHPKLMTVFNLVLNIHEKAFAKERASWRAVIFLNIVRSFHVILDAMGRVQSGNYPLWEHEDPDIPQLTAEHLKIQRRLGPLLQVENALIKQISPPNSLKANEPSVQDRTQGSTLKEVAVNSTTQWKDRFGRLVTGGRLSASEEGVEWDNSDDSGRLLRACAEDMIRLWGDPIIQELLRKLKIRMEDQAGLYALRISMTSRLIWVL